MMKIFILFYDLMEFLLKMNIGRARVNLVLAEFSISLSAPNPLLPSLFFL